MSSGSRVSGGDVDGVDMTHATVEGCNTFFLILFLKLRRLRHVLPNPKMDLKKKTKTATG